MPKKKSVRAGALLLLLLACSKASEGSAAGGGNSTLPAKEATTPPMVPAKAEPAPEIATAGTPDTASGAVPGQPEKEAEKTAAPSLAGGGEEVEARVLIWGGGRTPEEGRKALERFEAERDGLEAILTFGEGYPRVIASDTLPGLNPGFHVVILGACKPEEAEEVLETLQSFKQGVYTRAVKLVLESASCPNHVNGLVGNGTARLKDKPFELTAAAFLSVDPAAFSVPWLVRLYLRDEQGNLIDQKAMDPRDGMWDGTDRNSCQPLAEVEGSVIRVTVKCDALAGGPWPQERHVERKYRIAGGKIERLSSPY